MRQAQPYFKKSHQAWYVNLQGKPHRLGTEKEQAWKEYHRLMAAEAPVTSSTTAAAILERFLAWTAENREPKTYKWYAYHLVSFAKHIGARLRIADLKPYHADRWLACAHKRSSSTTKHGACRALMRAFNWARRQGLIAANPLAGLERPAAESREAYLDAADWDRLIKYIEGRPLADLLQFMRETGCRPYEARHVEARHWDRQQRRLTLELALTKGKKGKKLPRVIRLNERATEIMQRLALKHPKGEVFRDRRDRPWTAKRLDGACAYLRRRLGIKLFPYILRHTFCTDALLRGVDPVTVALLMGHKDGTMVLRVYNHLIRHDEFLQEKLKQATS